MVCGGKRFMETRKTILNCLDEWKDRTTIHEETGIPRTTIFDHVSKLIKQGKVIKMKVGNGLPGRSRVFWKIRNGK